jgi:hypothetical protein
MGEYKGGMEEQMGTSGELWEIWENIGDMGELLFSKGFDI